MKIVSATTPTGVRLIREGDGFVVAKSNSPFNQMSLNYAGAGGGAGERLTKPFAHSVWVQRAIKRVAEPIAAVPLEFCLPGGEGEVTIAELETFWSKPAFDRSGPVGRADFLEASIGWLKLCGECFWLMGDDWERPGKGRTPLIVARPDRMRPVLEGTRLLGWEWTDALGARHARPSELVVHLKFWNPYDDLRGLGEYESAKVATEADYLAGKFSLALMRNNGDQGIIVVAKNGMPTDEQQKQIVAALREKKAASARGEFRPVFFTGDVAIEDPKITTPDANFVATRLENRHEIAIAFGVPPSMFDVKASFSEGQSSDRYLLIVDTCMPLAQGKLADGIEQVTERLLGRRLKASFDFDEHDVMQQARRQRILSIAPLWGTGVPMEKINDVLQLGLEPFPGWEKSYLPFSVQEVGAEIPLPSEDQPPALPAGSEEDQAIEAMMLLLRQRTSGEPAPVLKIGARSGRDPERVKLWQRFMRQRQPSVKRFRSKFSKVLMSARAEVLAKIAKQGPVLLAQRAAASDFLFDPTKFGATLMQEMRKAAAAAVQEAGAQLFAEVGKDDVYSMPPARALQFLTDRENKLSNVADEIFARIKGTLTEGINGGDSTAKLAARIKGEFNDLDDARALTIAQTETAAAYGEARQDAADQAGVEWKEWLTSGLDNVRAFHLEAEGQRVRMNDPFQVGGEPLMYPSDSRGRPDNVINCHCVAIPVADSGETDS